MSDKYRKKPVVIDAVQWNGNNVDEVMSFIKNVAAYNVEFGTLDISTLEGTMTASMGDWVIKGVKGEFYPCKPDIFENTYEKVNDTQVISDHEIDWKFE
jgi:hypothetical protein